MIHRPGYRKEKDVGATPFRMRDARRSKAGVEFDQSYRPQPTPIERRLQQYSHGKLGPLLREAVGTPYLLEIGQISGSQLAAGKQGARQGQSPPPQLYNPRSLPSGDATQQQRTWRYGVRLWPSLLQAV